MVSAPVMNMLLVLSRTLHFAAALLLFGGFLLSLAVAVPATRGGEQTAVDIGERVGRFLRIVAWWALGVSLFSGAAWLIVEAALIGRGSIAEVTSGETLGLVVTGTVFGRVWIARFALIVALGVLLVARVSRPLERRSRADAWLALGLAAGLLGSLALVGHVAAARGEERYIRIVVDIVHLVAAGAWLGGLPGLVVLLTIALRASSAASVGIAARAARRFSTLGVASVGALLLSGFANAWFLVGSVPALVGTPYGRLLLAKVALFATMVALAAINRRRLTPNVDAGDVGALRMLARNAAFETAAGVAVVAIVGALGVAVPAAHQSPVWPFAFTLSAEPAESSAAVRWMLGACILTLCVIVPAHLWWSNRTARQRAFAYGSAAIVALLGASLLAVPAYPTTYAPSPVKYTTAAIAAGAVSYAANCVQCHGPHGRGDGPLATNLTIRPADLVEHQAHHRAGDLYWRIAHGIPETPMPAFSPQLDDAAIWALVQYLRALSEADTACALTGNVEPFVPIAAPDFTFEDAPHTQMALKQLRGREVLLVFATTPESLPRLREIGAKRDELANAGIRVIVIATRGEALPDGGRAMSDAPLSTLVGSDVQPTYEMLACSGPAGRASPPSPHVEWLIDRGGFLRARWWGFRSRAPTAPAK